MRRYGLLKNLLLSRILIFLFLFSQRNWVFQFRQRIKRWENSIHFEHETTVNTFKKGGFGVRVRLKTILRQILLGKSAIWLKYQLILRSLGAHTILSGRTPKKEKEEKKRSIINNKPHLHGKRMVRYATKYGIDTWSCVRSDGWSTTTIYRLVSPITCFSPYCTKW